MAENLLPPGILMGGGRLWRVLIEKPAWSGGEQDRQNGPPVWNTTGCRDVWNSLRGDGDVAEQTRRNAGFAERFFRRFFEN